MKRILVCLCIAFLAAAFSARQHAQTTVSGCNLKFANAPVVRGMRLGMTTDEVLALFPGSRENPNVQASLTPYYGRANVNLSSNDYRGFPLFKNVSQFNITLFDGSVSAIYVSYQGPPWNTVDDMTAKVSSVLNLPGTDKWTPSGDHAKALKCDGFEVKVTAYSGGTCCSSLQLEVPNIWQKVNDRKAAEEEKARKEFTP